MRTKKQVMAARNSPSGCCERYANNMACDCLGSLLHGPVIEGRFHYHQTPPGSTVDLSEPGAVPHDDTDEVVALGGMWYGHRLSSQPGLMAGNTVSEEAEKEMRQLIRHARQFVAMVHEEEGKRADAIPSLVLSDLEDVE
jgi:hypothetical protein